MARAAQFRPVIYAAEGGLPLRTQANFPRYVNRYAELKHQDKDLYECPYYRLFIYNQIRKYWLNINVADGVFHQVFGDDVPLPDLDKPPRMLKRYNFTDWERFLAKSLEEIYESVD